MSNQVNLKFSNMLSDILLQGTEVDTRNSITKRRMNQQVTFNHTPLVTVRRTAWKSALREMEWFLTGSNNIKDLHPSVHKWWAPWANESGYIHNNYSKQFRRFDGHGHRGGAKYCDDVDQIGYLLDAIKNHPFSRRSVITTWHTHDMLSPNTPITNCHGTVIQAFVEPDNSLHLTMYQRSSDMVVGLPHNFIQYWALIMWLAHRCGRTIGSFTWIGGDCHIYKDHYDLAQRMVDEARKDYDNGTAPVPNLIYNPTSEEFKADDFSLDSKYEPMLRESAKMVV